MNHDLRFTAAKIGQRLDLIRPFVFRLREDLPPFRFFPLENAIQDPPLGHEPSDWPEIPHESYWGHADLNFFMSTQFTVPDGWAADHLALHLPLGTFGDIFNHPEALVHIDGQPIGSADRYHHTIALPAFTADGRPHRLEMHGWTGHTQWPPDPSSRAKLLMGRPILGVRDPILQAFVALAETALDTCSALASDSTEQQGLLDALDAAFLALDTRAPLGNALYASAPHALDVLKNGIAQAGRPLDVTLHGIGHAHMDIAYLWPVDQSRRKNARTYSNVLRLMEADPAYRFSHSQPQLYDYCARDYPEIFESIKSRVAEGRWEVMGGMWVEPDLNMPGPEALVRQLTLGRKYFRDTLGDVETPVLWLPDTFGFVGQVPQLMQQAGLKWFCTNKLNWNQVTQVPCTHLWEGIDGTRVLAHVLTTPRDVQYLPFPTNYKSDLTAPEVLGTVERADDGSDLPICYGYGDGGGGPTEDLLAKLHAYQAMPGMPRIRFSSVRDAFEAIEAQGRDLPVHHGEHYMEGHRGVLTSQAWIKRANRLNERALHEAEALSVMANVAPGLDEAWKLLCLNQFHDVITGTSVPEVFDDARRDHARIAEMAESAARDACKALSRTIGAPAILNTCPVPADRLVILPDEVDEASVQSTEDGPLALATALPPYSVTSVADMVTAPPKGLSIVLAETGARLENAFVRISIDACGRVTSIWDKREDREALTDQAVGNQFQAFEDRPICWDAWDIDPTFQDRMDLIEESAVLSIIEEGPVRATLRVNFTWRNSTFRQDIRLAAHAARLDFKTEIDWHETHTLLKVAFPVAIQAPQAMYDIQWGTINRPTGRETPQDFAKFEVAAQKWALLQDDKRSFALLNDCKYGHDVTGNVMRLTLIKSSTAPDPNADQGLHNFTYAVMPMEKIDRGSLDAAAYDLNTPTRVILPKVTGIESVPPGPLVQLSGKRVIPESVVPVKKAEFLVRLFEPDGMAGIAKVRFGRMVNAVEICNFLGDHTETLHIKDNAVSFDISAFQIVTLRVI